MKMLPVLFILVVILIILTMNYYAMENGPRWIVKDLPGDRKAVTMPPFGIYIEPDSQNNDQIRKHELCHWQQYERKGLYDFYRDYFKLNAKYDYEDNPMEQECFIAEMGA